MTVTIHGTPGYSLDHSGDRYAAADRKQGAFHERAAAAALADWLTGLPGRYHLFHDLAGFGDVSGAGLPAMGIGAGNLDHVILSGSGCMIVNAKACAAGALMVGPDGHGYVERADGSRRAQPWMDNRQEWARCGIMCRLTGLVTCAVIVTPSHTEIDHATIGRARCMRRAVGGITSAQGVRDGLLADVMPRIFNGQEAEPGCVALLRRYLSTPDVPPRFLAPARRPAVPPARPRYPWETVA